MMKREFVYARMRIDAGYMMILVFVAYSHFIILLLTF